MSSQPSLNLKTARTLKWNAIDRFSTQILYAVVGIVLANVLSQSDFGEAGVILIFQAFAILFVDSGFGAALLQKKEPDEKDYSTVFWFNLIVSLAIYLILWIAAPLIADIFHSGNLIAMSRVMFLTFVINGLAIVQTNRLMKRMEVRQIAISNTVALTVSGIVAVWLALAGAGAWALVWQSVVQAAVKSVWLWVTGHWIPKVIMSHDALKSIWKVGLGVFTSSFLNTLCLNIYNFIIGAYYALATLGVYTQADKWSKMGIASLSQIFTATYIPVLSKYQDNRRKYSRIVGRINRLAALIIFPFMGGLIVAAAPLFHTLFGNKWNAAIILFQLLCLRGIFLILISLYNNYILAKGRSRSLVSVEVVKDLLLFLAIVATIGFGTVEALVWGQVASAVITYIVVLAITSREAGRSIRKFLSDMAPFAALTAAIMALLWLIPNVIPYAFPALAVQMAAGISIYIAVLHFTGNREFREIRKYLLGRFIRRKCSE